MPGDVQPYDEWGDRDPATELVVIANAEYDDRLAVEHLLDERLVGVA